MAQAPTVRRSIPVPSSIGTGKTKTLQLLAEKLSAAGVPVLLTDVKGDLSGIAASGARERPKRRRHARPRDHPLAVRNRAREALTHGV